ncbi:TIGR04219 family outer membrane beta-barrel protein [Caminibacter sp.]
MKKISLILAGVLFSGSLAYADIFSLSAGGGVEQQKIGGYVKSGDSKNYFGVKKPVPPNTGYFGLKDKSHPYFWVKIIHPIPLIPNIKFQYTKYDTTGHSNYIAANIKVFGDVSVNTVLTNADTALKINSYDLTLFYEFKPAVADIEIGAGADYWKGKFSIYDNTTDKYVVNSSWSVAIPYVYGSVETMKIFGFSVLGNAKFAKLGNNHHYEFLAALKYTIDIPGPVNPFIKAGYKFKEVQADKDGITKLNYRGAFIEGGFKF